MQPATTITVSNQSANPHLDVIAATASQAPILANLLELYIHDFSELLDLDLGQDGRFGYTPLPLYWTDPVRHPLLIKLNGTWAGFALVNRAHGEPGVWDMAEFFILRACRRRGAGTEAAHQVWRQFPGPWQVRVLHANTAARHFWAKAISQFAGETIHPAEIVKDRRHWVVFSFDSPRTAP